ncbi:MAG TPA: hypothetical protein VN426_09730 [Syntrophomonadaceae bacterium]|nr:hypothetical protein [Syntrophomonadaceae bacterium]
MMRSILRKLDRQTNLTDEEYRLLLEYVEEMGRKSPQSYALLYRQYAEVLESDYGTILPRHPIGMDDLVDFLLSHRHLLPGILQGPIALHQFPPELQPYVDYTFKHAEDYLYLQRLMGWLTEREDDAATLPQPRQGEVVCIYEDGNPHKETGLKNCFDRLGRYSFITRLQSYRYLTRGKANRDRIEILAPDQLGGIFTNKDKSIYYFIFLSESDPVKAGNACRLLNAIVGSPSLITSGGGGL